MARPGERRTSKKEHPGLPGAKRVPCHSVGGNAVSRNPEPQVPHRAGMHHLQPVSDLKEEHFQMFKGYPEGTNEHPEGTDEQARRDP